jgi:hypothetical protein
MGVQEGLRAGSFVGMTRGWGIGGLAAPGAKIFWFFFQKRTACLASFAGG